MPLYFLCVLLWQEKRKIPAVPNGELAETEEHGGHGGPELQRTGRSVWSVCERVMCGFVSSSHSQRPLGKTNHRWDLSNRRNVSCRGFLLLRIVCWEYKPRMFQTRTLALNSPYEIHPSLLKQTGVQIWQKSALKVQEILNILNHIKPHYFQSSVFCMTTTHSCLISFLLMTFKSQHLANKRLFPGSQMTVKVI